VTVTPVRLAKNPVSEDYFQRGVWRVGLQLKFLDGTSYPSHCLLSIDRSRFHADWRLTRFERDRDDDWRRIFAYSTISWLQSEAFRKFKSGSLAVSDDYLDEYVVIVADEAQVVAEYRLPTQSVKNLTSVSARAIAVTDVLDRGPRCAIAQ
jgi:hypothetical protein